MEARDRAVRSSVRMDAAAAAVTVGDGGGNWTTAVGAACVDVMLRWQWIDVGLGVA